MRAVKNLESTLQQVKKAVNDLKFKMEKASSPDEETNSKVYGPKEKDGIVPLEDLIVFNGSLEGKKVLVLKDDSCNTNVVCHDFLVEIEDTLIGRSAILK